MAVPSDKHNGKAGIGMGMIGVFIIILLVLWYIRQRLLMEEPKQMLQIGNGQTIGRRAEQDDYFATATTPLGTIAVLADGISGLANGRLASTIAVDVFIQEFQKLTSIEQIESFFARASRLSNSEIIHTLRGTKGGTTIVAAVIADGYLYWGAVGDSLIKIFRNQDFMTVNQKHVLQSVLHEQYLARQITKQDVLNNPLKHRLINYIGYEGFKNIEIGQQPLALYKGDKVILCSDGVYNSITEIEMAYILAEAASPYDAAQNIIEVIDCKKLRNQDNATIVIVEDGEQGYG
ncbi:PP2C family protein-serine/threonine phosphatase [Aneurinibacillus uraniidurans]|uniref:PP2C family protein-serine/threonine phosphatase n=1 Tax=Aneurinibacillus uraniidurans TaxID=2966586 RepID=UPI0023498E55|nr:protein phosphatase 2C domain-containing protein [Aneurinibacillus sp. B1]WCN36422.1 protein phosphatase 2C domain-containing protein [Aneurinibacillus sp. B1]